MQIWLKVNSQGEEEPVPINFLRVNWDDVSELTLRKCARLYCSIWREPPWNEDFWQEDNVLNDLLTEIEKECAEGFIATFKMPEFRWYNPKKPLEIRKKFTPKEFYTVVAGFTWGYIVSRKNMRAIAGNDKLDFLFQNGAKIFYIDELGVALDYRKHGVGMQLSSLLLQAAKTHSATTALLRTDEQAVAARQLYSSLGFQDLQIKDEGHPQRTYLTLDLANFQSWRKRKRILKTALVLE